MMINLTQLNKLKIAINLIRVDKIEEYINNASKISITREDGSFLHHLYVMESIDQICEIANKINAINKNHQITIYYRKSQFD